MDMSAAGGAGLLAYFVRRWRRQTPLGLLVWRDMVLVGSLLNLAAAFGGLLALGFKADLAVAMAVFFSPMPYNVFLVLAVWRTADLAAPAEAWTVRTGAAAWLAVVTVL